LSDALHQSFGNLLKVDEYGYILVAVHGRARLKSEEVRAQYPSKFIHPDDIGKRYYVLNTLFNMPGAPRRSPTRCEYPHHLSLSQKPVSWQT
jgi:hypothetical protein